MLKKWGDRLATDTRAELQAAGKAIAILIDEVERLQVETERARGTSKTPLIEAGTRETTPEPIEAASSQSLGSSLRERLSAVIPSRGAFGAEE